MTTKFSPLRIDWAQVVTSEIEDKIIDTDLSQNSGRGNLVLHTANLDPETVYALDMGSFKVKFDERLNEALESVGHKKGSSLAKSARQFSDSFWQIKGRASVDKEAFIEGIKERRGTPSSTELAYEFLGAIKCNLTQDGTLMSRTVEVKHKKKHLLAASHRSLTVAGFTPPSKEL